MKSESNFLHVLLLTLLLAMAAQPAHAFYNWQGEGGELEFRALLRATAIALENPDNSPFFESKRVTGAAASGRLMLDAGTMDLFTFEAHVVQDFVPLRLQTGGSSFSPVQGVERSDWLDWRYGGGRARLELDRLNVQLSSGRLNTKIGRQPVNLAATFYFTPNDFFAPFAAQTFFRAYKPGVDAVRADIRLAELSQLSLISVLGYRSDLTGDNGWSNRPDAARISYLARTSAAFAGFELALLGGVIRRDRVIGIDFQGELFDLLGVRGEGHVNFPDRAGQKRSIEFALGLEHRWESSFHLRIEQFYHGSGAGNAGNYIFGGVNSSFYLARHYTAIGASYEFTPLLNGDATLVGNWGDRSALAALYLLYSLSDESELAVNANIPIGAKPVGPAIQSEFGQYPFSFHAEARVYF